MTMTIDNQQRHHLGGMGYDHMAYPSQPHFTNPWGGATTSPHASSQLFATSMASSNLPYDALSKPQSARSTTMSMPYNSQPAAAPPAGNGSYSTVPYGQSELLSSSQDLLSGARPSYDQGYSAAPQVATTYAPSTSSFAPIGSYGPSLAQQQQQQQQDRPIHSTAPLSQTHASAFGDALDGARGMVAMSQTDITPRNIYGPRGDRGFADSYGFPATHSAHSSVSSGSGYPSYSSGSVDSSVSDYSSASESIDGMNSRRLPRPSGLITNMPPAPQSMMGSFNSKVSASTQKKHKCKVCDKRFTRPSSLQTHMYSHTGEKPFSCEVDGCGRNFSVVSNLRRHRKVHKGEHMESDHGSPEGSWASSKE